TTGCSDATIALSSRVFLVQDASAPCPPCVGDPTPNDGVPEGTCIGGTTPDAACDAQGDDPQFDTAAGNQGVTSNDCLPRGSSVGELAVDLAPLTTGATSLTAHVDCLSGAFPAGSCMCPGQVQPNACIPDGTCPASGVCEHGPIDAVCDRQTFRQCRSGTGT